MVKYCTILLLLSLTLSTVVNAQVKFAQPPFVIDSTNMKTAVVAAPTHSIRLRNFIVPAVFMAYGAASLIHENNPVLNINTSVREVIWEKNPHDAFRFDDYAQYAPAVAVYALNAAGVHGAHKFGDRTALLALSQAFSLTISLGTKNLTHVMRPDSSNDKSFPSGHTTNAFTNAEFMRQEYWDVSPWYGIAAYAAAIGTGTLRMYNNKHWLSDVVAGAGVGIASTRLSYWLYPKIKKAFFKHRNGNAMLLPSYNGASYGLTFQYSFE